MIRVSMCSHPKDKIQAYLKKWQKPSLLYAGRLGITLNLPDKEEDLDDLISDEVCPIYTNEEIEEHSLEEIYDDFKIIEVNAVLTKVNYDDKEYYVDDFSSLLKHLQ